VDGVVKDAFHQRDLYLPEVDPDEEFKIQGTVAEAAGTRFAKAEAVLDTCRRYATLLSVKDNLMGRRFEK
jgi:hypothetical protein